MKTRFAFVGAALLLAAMVLGLNPLQPANATHEPANKVSAAGASNEVIAPGDDVVLLSEKVKTSKPTDLILGVTAECAITTEVTTVGDDNQQAEGTIEVWIEIDGTKVPVAADDTGADAGEVVFCNRLYRRQTSLFDDENATITTFMETRTANGFNWMALNVGSATHTIEVKARLTTTETQKATALAAIGKRTLIVEPVKAGNHEDVTAIG